MDKYVVPAGLGQVMMFVAGLTMAQAALSSSAIAGGVWNNTTCQVDDNGKSDGYGDVAIASEELSGTTIYYPANIASSGCTYTVIGWANGSGTFGGEAYPIFFQYLVSYGFVVAASHAGIATPASLEASVNDVLALNDAPGHPLEGKLNATFGLMGKSLGGMVAHRLSCLSGAEAIATIGAADTMAWRPTTKPTLFATGNRDFLEALVFLGYIQAGGQAIYAEERQNNIPGIFFDHLLGHLKLGESEEIARITTSFMRCYLRNDPRTCDHVANERKSWRVWTGYQAK